jgi:hypothetical protein
MSVHHGGRGPGHLSRSIGGTFSPLSLFTAGEQGVWYDPSDFSTMFQDSVGATPVTAVGQVVGKINDKSGRGNHATQATAASKPILRQDGGGKYYLEFDGFDDFLATAAINFSATDEMTAVIGVRKLRDSATEVLLENGTGFGTFRFFQFAASTDWTYGSTGTLSAEATDPAGAAAPLTSVLAGKSDISGDAAILRVNGTQVRTVATDQGTGNYGNSAMYLGRRGGTTFPFSGNVYQLVVRGNTTTDLAPLETFVNSKTGAY